MTTTQKNILIIEDDDLINQMYGASLANSNFKVQFEKDGESGWNALQKSTPDLLILDFMMPKLNGLEILQKMKADSRLNTVPVVMMSSLSSTTDKERAMSAGATAYWVKNEVNMIEFEAKINELIK